ncbi:MAG TPA: 1-(5-phosphoribosyl)-5-[(5-phosphoribosylamino)methylideneamino] imidazole-4-carboxamide isomerase [Ignavibacteriales bacterium]|nr:1-(5-phosphoribosyl)-5-[(5-phosphoribosylamino)methylideneamino] imidazole-4-carboxamide isomerase [Ignavibacteriales bacterium]HOL81164.1 1-(5-phosphoribosyl)-5-[(5-phosphoribosylamino)methylideneamino] imidazole-4-carboxamide isomerase [Ignavibacteriales bacterium]HOM65267.1 1-(5-phosphoribosyl)-5-[(5-phosphoribosylamino)methylideneamino] imidazole-4-carboxamide isomerase [Ignavibacteriales bacterium]HPD66559.1 1-(5-phosphoribosyl)-5-[(5-phosphoribosylamino)methylideneamino] imidazole-4-car
MKIIPAIDILNNKIVRLRKGDYNQVEYYDYDILKLVEKYYRNGFKRLHLVDLLGAKEGKIYISDIIKNIKANFNDIQLQFGGGIRNSDTVKFLQDLGVNYYVIGSLPIVNSTEFENILQILTLNQIILASDVDNDIIVIKGWIEKTNITIWNYIDKYFEYGIKSYLCTDINKDGMLQGPNFELYKKLQSYKNNIQIIASGGISNITDVIALNKNNIWGCVLGKSLLDNKIKIEELNNLVS